MKKGHEAKVFVIICAGGLFWAGTNWTTRYGSAKVYDPMPREAVEALMSSISGSAAFISTKTYAEICS